jgi:hypothetical protein
MPAAKGSGLGSGACTRGIPPSPAQLAMANDSPAMMLDAAISKLSTATDRDRRGEDMLAAAQWQPQPPGQPEQRGDPDHAATDPAKHDAHKDGEMLQQRSQKNVSLDWQLHRRAI